MPARFARWQLWCAAALIALPLAAFSAWDSAANVLARDNPVLLKRLAPTDPRGFPWLQDRGLALGSTRTSRAEHKALQNGLRAMPLSSRILRLLANSPQEPSEPRNSGHLMSLAGHVSRRDLLTEANLANAAAQRGDAPAVMLHVNAALSTSQGAQDLLFPLLAQTLADPKFLPLVARYMSQDWADEFLHYAAQNTAPERVLDVALRNPKVQSEARFEKTRTELLSHLVQAGKTREAFAYARRLRGLDAILKDPGFSKATSDPRFMPLTWSLTNNSGIYAELLGRTVSVSVDPGANGVALQRVLHITAGQWALTMPVSLVGPAELFKAELVVSCVEGQASRPLATTQLRPDSTPRDTQLDLRVDRSCEALRISVNVHNLDDQKTSELILGDPVLNPRGN